MAGAVCDPWGASLEGPIDVAAKHHGVAEQLRAHRHRKTLMVTDTLNCYIALAV